MKSILEYYKGGGDPDMYESRREKYRKNYKDWTESLEHFYNEKKVKLSGNMLIKHMESKQVAAYKIPSARFASARFRFRACLCKQRRANNTLT